MFSLAYTYRCRMEGDTDGLLSEISKLFNERVLPPENGT